MLVYNLIRLAYNLSEVEMLAGGRAGEGCAEEGRDHSSPGCQEMQVSKVGAQSHKGEKSVAVYLQYLPYTASVV